MRRVFSVALVALGLSGCANHPVDCALGFAHFDCLPGTEGYANRQAGYRFVPTLMPVAPAFPTAAAAPAPYYMMPENRPVTTNCSTFGGVTTCQTR